MPIFFEITAPHSGNKHYLLGTMHDSDKIINTLPLDVKLALKQASGLIVEANSLKHDAEDEAGLQRAINKWFASHGQAHLDWAQDETKVDAVVNQVRKTTPWYIPRSFTKAYVKDAFPGTLSNNTKPVSFDTLLDTQLVKYAIKNRKWVFPLDLAEEQTNLLLMTDFSYQEQREMAELQISEDTDTKHKTMKQLYIKGNMDALYNFDKDNAAKHPLSMRFFKMSVDDRDAIMTSRIYPILFSQEKVFIAVGTVHLKGIIQNLSRSGFSIKPIPMSKRIYPVLEFYDRNINSMVATGLWFISAGAAFTVGKTIRSERMGWGLKLMGIAVAAAMTARSMGLVYEYLVEPTLPSVPDDHEEIDTTRMTKS